MSITNQEIRYKGRDIMVPTTEIQGRTVAVTGRWLKIAKIRDEELVEGGVVPEPESFLRQLKASGLKADIITFPQWLDQHDPKYKFPFEWDNAAIVRTDNYDAWWNGLPQEARKNARRASKRGVTVDVVKLDDEFVKGIKRIYDETPFRQGRKFWHYGKDPARIKLENETYLERSEFIGAYCEGELIGFMKWVYTDNAGILMQILSMNAHYDKRPMNAMIAKAVEVCGQRGAKFLVYSKFTFGNKAASQLAEFKRRIGFSQIDFPRYYVPLTLKGKLALKLKLHLSLIEVLPAGVIDVLLKIRSGLIGILPKALTHRKGQEEEPAAAKPGKPQAEGAD